MALKGRIKGATHRLILRLVEKVEHGHIVVQGAQIKRLRRSAIGIADQYPDGTPPKAFYLSALYNYVAVFYLLDKPKNKPMGGAFYPSLERHGLQYLLDPIQTLLREPMGTTTFGEVVRVVRNKVVVHSTYRDSDLNLPRFRGHPRSHESAVGVCHGETEAAGVHEGVQGGGRAACPGKRQVRADRGAGTRSDGDGAAELGAAGGD